VGHLHRHACVSTRQQRAERSIAVAGGLAGHALGLLDPAESVALVARARRELLLACHRHRLGREDLEDCYSQATLELLTRIRRGEGFVGHAHIANALEQKFLSRIHDRRRALSGRSPIQAALASSLPLTVGACGVADVADTRADVERLTFLRHDLRNIARLSQALSSDQRLVLASELSGEPGCAEFCRKHGWSTDKYRKVAQRARTRLLRLLAGESTQIQGGARVPHERARRISEQGHTYETSSPNT
jgi:DNA-directed RNA polymerase specialized sigma24 family protein